MAQMVENLPAMQKTWVQSVGHLILKHIYIANIHLGFVLLITEWIFLSLDSSSQR